MQERSYRACYGLLTQRAIVVQFVADSQMSFTETFPRPTRLRSHRCQTLHFVSATMAVARGAAEPVSKGAKGASADVARGGGRNSVSRHSSASQRRLNIITL